MVTYVTPYCAIGGHDFSGIIYAGGVEPSGGGAGVEEITVPGRNYGDIRSKGRAAKKYRIRARSTDRDEIEEFLEVVNTAEEDAEFYPFDAARFGLIASAFASAKISKQWGTGKVFYEADAEITCREAWLYGPDQGRALAHGEFLPYVSAALSNAGQERAPLNFLQAGGRAGGGTTAVHISKIAVGVDHTIYGIDASTTAAKRWNGASWELLGGACLEIAALDSTTAYVVGIDDRIYSIISGGFGLLSATTVHKISIASDGTLYAIDYATDAALKWNGAGWTDLGGSWKEIAGYSSTLYYTIGADNKVYSSATGLLSATTVHKISVASDGTLYAIDYTTDAALRWTGAGWTNLGGTWTEIAAYSSDAFYAINSGNHVFVVLSGTAIALESPVYVEDLSVRITPGTSSDEHDREIALCEKLLGNDIFEFGWRRKEATHSWEADLAQSWTELAWQVHGKTSGGSIAASVLTLDNGDYIMIPFYGPLPISGSAGAACLELDVTAITGDAATCQVALLTDISDMVAVDHDALVVGSNTIYMPDLEGESHVAIGLKAGAAGSISLSGIKGTVKRYVAPSQIPFADPGESFKIRVESTAGTQLASLQVDYNNRYWY